jgi:hypothetical protein
VTDATSDKTTAHFRIPFLVGVAGHRDLLPGELPAIRAAVDKLLRALRDAEPDVAIQLLSPMADGADLLAADVADSLGLEVIALLPYGAAQCRADLDTDASRAVFDRVMQRAEVLEMPLPATADQEQLAVPGEARDRQFLKAGELVARCSSLLIVIWDGRDTDHRAGTARVVESRRRGLSPNDDDGPATGLLLSAGDNDWIYDIRCSRRSAVSGPDSSGVEVRGFTSGDRQHGSIEQGLPAALQTLLEGTAGFNRDAAEYREDIARGGQRLAPASPYLMPDALRYVDRLFTASDWLGGHFRRCFTRALRARYSLWATLAFLLLGLHGSRNDLLDVANIALVLLVFGAGWALAFWAHRRKWHRRFLDYRALAEGLRVDFYWEIAGVRAEFAGRFAHESFLQKQDVELEWIRAAMRTVGLRCALYPRTAWPHGFEHAYAAWIGDPDPVNGSGQLLYYRRSTQALERRQKITERLSRALLFGGLALGIALAVDTGFAFLGQSLVSQGQRDSLVFGLAMITVYGAIFEIYLHEKADRSLIRQYRYMDSLFSFTARALRASPSRADQLHILRSLGHACLAEHAQWALAHRDMRIDGLRW